MSREQSPSSAPEQSDPIYIDSSAGLLIHKHKCLLLSCWLVGGGEKSQWSPGHSRPYSAVKLSIATRSGQLLLGGKALEHHYLHFDKSMRCCEGSGRMRAGSGLSKHKRCC